MFQGLRIRRLTRDPQGLPVKADISSSHTRHYIGGEKTKNGQRKIPMRGPDLWSVNSGLRRGSSTEGKKWKSKEYLRFDFQEVQDRRFRAPRASVIGNKGEKEGRGLRR